MQHKRISYALRGAIGFGIAGVLTSFMFHVYPALDEKGTSSMVVFWVSVFLVMVFTGIGALFLIFERFTWRLLLVSLAFGAVLVLGAFLISMPSELLLELASNGGRLQQPPPTGVAYDILGALGIGFCFGLAAMCLRRFLAIGSAKTLQVGGWAFAAFAIGMAITEWGIKTPLHDSPVSRIIADAASFAVGGLLFGLVLDFLARKRALPPSSEKPAATLAPSA